MAVIQCTACGHRNDDGAQFCAACDEFIGWDAGPGSPPPPPEPAMPPRSEPATPPRSEAPSTPPPAEPVAVSPPPGAASRSRSDEPAPSSDPDDTVARALQFLADGEALVRSQGRDDLRGQLDQVRERLATEELGVIVLGEFKQGKSTLVNAIVNAAVCPVDADIVTAVPTIVGYGSEPSAVVHYGPLDPPAGEDPDGQRATTRSVPIPFDQVADVVREPTDPSAGVAPRAVEVRIDRRVLRDGLTLIDTPGVGGLDSAQGHLTLATLPLARAVLFVTDASQELTAPELEFLRLASARCGSVLLVVTKTDLYVDWRRIVELDARHLADAGLDIDIVAVSSFLRLLAAPRADRGLDQESGYPTLIEHLLRTVARGRAEAASAAAREVEAAVDHVRTAHTAEREALARPDRPAAVVAEAVRAHASATRLGTAEASWRQVLTDGVQDLASDVEHDLRERLRRITREVDAVLAAGDPAEDWEGFQHWLRRLVSVQLVENLDLLTSRANELAAMVGQHFEREAPVRLAGRAQPVAGADLERIVLQATFAAERDHRTAMAVTVARSSHWGVLMGGMVGNLLAAAGAGTWTLVGVSLPVAGVVGAPVAAALAVGMGRKALRDERARLLVARRQQATAAVRAYLDQVASTATKATRDALRATQRELRDEFTRRAQVLQRSTAQAVAATERAAALPAEERAPRARQADAELARLDRLAERAGALADELAERVPG